MFYQTHTQENDSIRLMRSTCPQSNHCGPLLLYYNNYVWTKLPTKLPPIKRQISDSKIVQGFINYCWDHSRIIYPAKFQVNFTFDTKEELANHVWSRVRRGAPLFVDEQELEAQRLAMKDEIATYTRSPLEGFFGWLHKYKFNQWYGQLMYKLGRFCRDQGDKAMNPKEYKWRTKYVYHKNYETNALTKKRKKQHKRAATKTLGTL